MIIIYDKGKFNVTGWTNSNEAVGAVHSYFHQDRLNEMKRGFANETINFPPIDGRIIFHEGGEFSALGFIDPYQLLGFMMVNLGELQAFRLMDALTKTTPEKFGDMQALAWKKHQEWRAREIGQADELKTKGKELNKFDMDVTPKGEVPQ